jgi:DNA-binding IclR family transcriptional regulator
MTEISSRTLRVLQLFSSAQALWSIDQIADALGVSSSSAYRYVQDLSAAGLLYRVDGGGYALGPAIIELDFLIRHHDPLIAMAAPAMRRLLDQTTQRGAVILCRRFRDCVMCIHQEQGHLPHRRAGYERGVAMPLFLGATSRVILAHEPGRVQRRIYLENEGTIRARGGVSSWKEFAALASRIRRQGFAESESEVTPGVRGIAAPVFQGARLVAALSLVTNTTARGAPSLQDFREQVIQVSRGLSGSLEPETLTRISMQTAEPSS